MVIEDTNINLYRAQGQLALACRQDSGIEFHLNDQQIVQFNGNNETFAKSWKELTEAK